MSFANLSLRLKIMLPTFLLVLIILAASTWLMTKEAQELAIRQGIVLANDQAEIASLQIKDTLDSAMSVTRTLQAIFDEAANADPVPKREFLADMLRTTLDRHPELSGSWIACQPGTFDDREEEYNEVWKGTMRVYHYRDNGKIATSYGGTTNLSGDWFDIPMAGNVETITKPYPWTVNGKTNWLDSTGFPVKKNGKNICVTGVDFYLTDLQAMVKAIKPFGEGHGYLVSNDGTVIAHPSSDMLGKNIGESLSPEHKAAYLRAVEQGEQYSFQRKSSETGAYEYVTALPISIGRSDSRWSLGVVLPLKIVQKEAEAVAHTGIMISSVAILILFILLFLLSRIISRPVLKTAEYTIQVAGGNLDATLDIDQTDEIGRMVSSMKSMVSKLKESIAQAETKSLEAEKESKKAKEAMAEAEDARKQAVQARREGLLAAAKRVAKVLERVVSTSREMSSQSNELLKGTEMQSERIASTATAMEEMNATILEIAKNASDAATAGQQAQEKAHDGAKIADESRKAMDSTMTEVNNLNENMSKLDEKAKGIGAIIGVINDIADQTNLLALNAAIEAARAGEAGRGFAVVADEVRKLAEKTMSATKEVSDSIGSIQHVASNNIHAMEAVFKLISGAGERSNRSSDILLEIVSGAEMSAAQIGSIATAAEEQSSTSEEINSAIERINHITQETTVRAEEFVKALRALAEEINELDMIVEDLNKGTDEA